MKKEDLVDNIYSYNQKGDFAFVEHKMIVDEEDIMLISFMRKNEQFLLVVAVKVSTKSNEWLWFIPTEKQILWLKRSEAILGMFNASNDKISTLIT